MSRFDPILSEREVNEFCNAPGRASRGGLRVYDSHESMRRRLAEVEQALGDARECRHDVDDHSLSGTDDGWWRCDACGCRVSMRSDAVLDKGEPTTSPDLPQERSDAERLAALNALRAAEGNAPLAALPPECQP